jgi:hypothetical protein
VALVIPTALVDLAEELVEPLQDNVLLQAFGPITSETVLKFALACGLEHLRLNGPQEASLCTGLLSVCPSSSSAGGPPPFDDEIPF